MYDGNTLVGVMSPQSFYAMSVGGHKPEGYEHQRRLQISVAGRHKPTGYERDRLNISVAGYTVGQQKTIPVDVQLDKREVERRLGFALAPYNDKAQARYDRWCDQKNKGWMGDKPNRVALVGVGAHARVYVSHDVIERVEVPAGFVNIIYTQPNFQGNRIVRKQTECQAIRPATISSILIPQQLYKELFEGSAFGSSQPITEAVAGVIQKLTDACYWTSEANFDNDPFIQKARQLRAEVAKFFVSGGRYIGEGAGILQKLDRTLDEGAIRASQCKSAPGASQPAAADQSAAQSQRAASPTACVAPARYIGTDRIAALYRAAPTWDEVTPNCFAPACPKGTQRAMGPQMIQAYRDLGYTELQPGCFAAPGARAAAAPKKKAAPRQAKSFRGSFIRGYWNTGGYFLAPPSLF